MAEGEFAAIDEQKFKSFHWLATLTTGLGVFCDGYDLSSLGLVLPQVLASFGHVKLTDLQTAMLTASALIGSVVGALAFGVLGQWGRKRFYGVDVLILGLAALAQAFAPDLVWLVALRFILGIGVGGDYVLSPTIMAEHANRADRGRALGLGFGTMWPLGALAAALFKLLLDALGVSSELEWRIVLAAGAVPALGVLYLRRRMPETARFLGRLAGEGDEAVKVIQRITGAAATAPSRDARAFWAVFAQHRRAILSAAVLWMLYDLVIYGGILFGPNLIAQSMGIGPVKFSILLQIIFILPASVLGSIFLIDRIGRKPLQAWGFLVGAVLVAIFALMQHQLLAMPVLGFFVFGLFNIAETGPGLVSGAGMLGVELAPTRIRTVAQSVTVAGGRIGAAISSFAFPLLFKQMGPSGPYWIIAVIAALGAVATWLLVPETGRVSLEVLTETPEKLGSRPVNIAGD
ncbi:MAG TPA: MFS transporter [Caulobacteraceae bacterium]